MEHYNRFGFNKFYIATGYKSKIIENYFKDKKLQIGMLRLYIQCKNVMTGGRLKRLHKFFKNEENFF